MTESSSPSSLSADCRSDELPPVCVTSGYPSRAGVGRSDGQNSARRTRPGTGRNAGGSKKSLPEITSFSGGMTRAGRTRGTAHSNSLFKRPARTRLPRTRGSGRPQLRRTGHCLRCRSRCAQTAPDLQRCRRQPPFRACQARLRVLDASRQDSGADTCRRAPVLTLPAANTWYRSRVYPSFLTVKDRVAPLLVAP